MKYILKLHKEGSEEIELPVPFLGNRGDYIIIHHREFCVRLCEWDYDKMIVYVFVDLA